MPVSDLELVDLGIDMHRQILAFSREERLMIAATVMTTALHEFPREGRTEAFETVCNRAALAVQAAAREGLPR